MTKMVTMMRVQRLTLYTMIDINVCVCVFNPDTSSGGDGKSSTPKDSQDGLNLVTSVPTKKWEPPSYVNCHYD